jgi:hypothetical protein
VFVDIITRDAMDGVAHVIVAYVAKQVGYRIMISKLVCYVFVGTWAICVLSGVVVLVAAGSGSPLQLAQQGWPLQSIPLGFL